MHDGSGDSFFVEQFQNGASISPHQHMIFQRYHHLGSAGKKFRRPDVEWLGKARIDNRDVKSLGEQLHRRFAGKSHHITERE